MSRAATPSAKSDDLSGENRRRADGWPKFGESRNKGDSFAFPRPSLWRGWAVAIVLGLAGASAFAQTTEAVSIPSIARFNQPGQPIQIPATLHLPPGDGRVPLVVISNSSGGANDLFLTALVKPLIDAGFAVLPLDSYTPRQVRDTATNQLQVSTLDMQKDAVEALAMLSTHARVDIARTAITGHSKGGAVAVNLSVEGAYKLAGARPGMRFTVAAPIAAGCDVRFIDNRLAVKEVRMFHGERDDWNPPEVCRALVKDWVAAGGRADFTEYPGASHSFSRSGTRYDPAVWTFKGCEGKTLAWSEDASHMIVDGKTMPRADALKLCWSGRGVNRGGDMTAMPEVVRDVTAFLVSASR